MTAADDDGSGMSEHERYQPVLAPVDLPHAPTITLNQYIEMLEMLRDSVPDGGELTVQKWVAEGRVCAQPPRISYLTVRRGLPQFWQIGDELGAKGAPCVQV